MYPTSSLGSNEKIFITTQFSDKRPTSLLHDLLPYLELNSQEDFKILYLAPHIKEFQKQDPELQRAFISAIAEFIQKKILPNYPLDFQKRIIEAMRIFLIEIFTESFAKDFPVYEISGCIQDLITIFTFKKLPPHFISNLTFSYSMHIEELFAGFATNIISGYRTLPIEKAASNAQEAREFLLCNYISKYTLEFFSNQCNLKVTGPVAKYLVQIYTPHTLPEVLFEILTYPESSSDFYTQLLYYTKESYLVFIKAIFDSDKDSTVVKKMNQNLNNLKKQLGFFNNQNERAHVERWLDYLECLFEERYDQSTMFKKISYLLQTPENYFDDKLILKQAKMAASSKDREEVLPNLKRILCPESLIESGKIYWFEGDIENAKRDLELGLKNDKTSAAAHVFLGSIYSVENQLDLSEKHLQLAIQIDENQYEAYVLLGEIYRNQELYSKAIKFFEKSLQLNQKDNTHLILSHGYLGIARLDSNDKEGALDNFNEVLKLTWGCHREIRILRAGIYFSQGRYNEAEEDFEIASMLEPDPLFQFIDEDYDLSIKAMYSRIDMP